MTTRLKITVEGENEPKAIPLDSLPERMLVRMWSGAIGVVALQQNSKKTVVVLTDMGGKPRAWVGSSGDVIETLGLLKVKVVGK